MTILKILETIETFRGRGVKEGGAGVPDPHFSGSFIRKLIIYKTSTESVPGVASWVAVGDHKRWVPLHKR